MKILVRYFFKGVRLVLAPVMIARDRFGRPEPVTRTQRAQAEVDRACQSLTLYQFRTCPFCVKVRHEMHRLALPIALRDTQHDDAARQALKAGGGRVKVPCLAIEENGGTEWMYESDAIKAYLQKRFEPDTATV
ncbi:glutaredoxin family protein [Kushneria indalinina]|uniref:Glutaredoxin n=1 Tax=Kushneria indalinina DSM 14324 TaxID=1122140 RepID=A0A3D9DUB4_9GAMM|nr:glutaredoxin domain-containing protein [Kushneria indalinina]REC94235.1 glutaredoxin [Kushneria indalinina DSM 14324]